MVRGRSLVGTGIIIDQNGLILTSSRLVGTDSSVVIQFTGVQQTTGDVVGIDQRAGLALVEVRRTGLQPAIFADSTLVGLGEDVIAIAMIEGTSGPRVVVSKAIISSIQPDAQGRTLVSTSAFQTTSHYGGPLINEQGEVIAIGVQEPGVTTFTSIVGLVLDAAQREVDSLKSGKHFYLPTDLPFEDVVLPINYSGPVTINGQPAPDGLLIFARVDDYVTEWRETTDGRYSSLIVSPPSNDYIGRPIIFYINGFLASPATQVFRTSQVPSEPFIILRDFTLSLSTPLGP